MNYQELSIKNLKETDKKLYNLFNKEFKYDLVIFVARGAYLIGKDFSNFNNCPLLEIKASRSGGKLKKLLRPVLCLIPEKLKIFLRKKELNSNVHKENSERNVIFDQEKYQENIKAKKILLVDDSIDTGYTIKSAKEAICKFFNKAEVKVAVLNYFDKAKDVFTPDYHLYKDTIIKGPWSNDSKENKKYLNMYYKWRDEENVK